MRKTKKLLIWFWIILALAVPLFIYLKGNRNNGTRNNDNFIDSNFWSKKPSDEMIINAIYWKSWDSTAYTLWRPETCTNLSVVHIKETNWLPSTLKENTIYVLDTDKIINDLQITMSKCSAIISSLAVKTTIYSSIQKSGYDILIENKQYCVLDNLNIDWIWNGSWWTHGKNNSVLISWSTYNTLNWIISSGHMAVWIYVLYWSNYNKLFNIIWHNNWKNETRWAWVWFGKDSSYNFAYWITGYKNTDAWIWLYWATYNVICNASTFNNGRLGTFFWNDASNNIIINLKSNNNKAYWVYPNWINYYYWFIDIHSNGQNNQKNLKLYKGNDVNSKCSISYDITWSTNQNVIASLVWCKAINNSWLDTYEFTENWTFTFEYQDEWDLNFSFDFNDMINYCTQGKRTITASVDRINTYLINFIDWSRVIKSWRIDFWHDSQSMRPIDPQRTWYIFDGRHEDGKDETFNFNRPVTHDINLYTKRITWVNITFDTNWWNLIKSQMIPMWWKIPQPINPRKAWYVFDGRYISGTDEIFDFNDPIMRDINLYVKRITWVNITFNANWWNFVPNQTLPIWWKISKPVIANRIWYIFIWWYESGANEPFNFDKVIEEDLTLYAMRWLCAEWYHIESWVCVDDEKDFIDRENTYMHVQNNGKITRYGTSLANIYDDRIGITCYLNYYLDNEEALNISYIKYWTISQKLTFTSDWKKYTEYMLMKDNKMYMRWERLGNWIGRIYSWDTNIDKIIRWYEEGGMTDEKLKCIKWIENDSVLYIPTWIYFTDLSNYK